MQIFKYSNMKRNRNTNPNFKKKGQLKFNSNQTTFFNDLLQNV